MLISNGSQVLYIEGVAETGTQKDQSLAFAIEVSQMSSGHLRIGSTVDLAAFAAAPTSDWSSLEQAKAIYQQHNQWIRQALAALVA